MLQMREKGLLRLRVNGADREVAARPADTLLWVLREQLGLTAAKPACENGDCDTCTVLLDGWPVKACLILAVEAVGHEVTTLEGLVSVPVQSAFVEHFAVACGYCTPGLVVNCHALVNHHPDADDAVIAEWLESNLCRCMGYEEVREAVKETLRRSLAGG